MDRVYNFSAGPSIMPQEALETAASEMLNYKGSGMSVMEMTHRGKAYLAIYDDAVDRVKRLMKVPENYKILFLQGGATQQFAAIPMNLLTGSGKADYLDSGNFAHGALVEAGKYGKVQVVASSRDDNYAHIPLWDDAALDPEADYCYITTNNTIYGTCYSRLPKGKAPLVADMSSNILSQVYDVNDFGVIFAGAQKNIGPAGVTLVIVREDLLGRAMAITPKVMDWQKQADAGSMLNTPPTYGIYMAGLCLKWLAEQGGVEAIEKVNIEKARLLYEYLDESRLFHGTAEPGSRSRMNVTFRTGNEETDADFVKAAAGRGLASLKGHRLVGGMRASIYNAMPIEGVKALVNFMKEYEAHVQH